MKFLKHKYQKSAIIKLVSHIKLILGYGDKNSTDFIFNIDIAIFYTLLCKTETSYEKSSIN